MFKYFVFTFLAVGVFAEIPSYIKICGRKNPNLNKCILDSVEGLREKLQTGIPELDTPSLEPLTLPGFALSETEQLTAFAKNVKLDGLSKFQIKNLHMDFEKKEIDMEVKFNNVALEADYDVKARILVPIAGKGPISILSNDVQAIVKLKYKLVKRNGAEYMFFTSMTTKLSIRDYKADFKPVEGSDNTLRSAINAALDGGRQEIIGTVTPNIEKVISQEILKFSNKICTHFTFDELFPDRE